MFKKLYVYAKSHNNKKSNYFNKITAFTLRTLGRFMLEIIKLIRLNYLYIVNLL